MLSLLTPHFSVLGHSNFIPKLLNLRWSQFKFDFFSSPCWPCNCFLLAVLCVLVGTCQRDLPLTHCRQLTDLKCCGVFGQGAVCLQSLPSETGGRVRRWDAPWCSAVEQTTQTRVWTRCVLVTISGWPCEPLYPARTRNPCWGVFDLLFLDVKCPAHQSCPCISAVAVTTERSYLPVWVEILQYIVMLNHLKDFV